MRTPSWNFLLILCASLHQRTVSSSEQADGAMTAECRENSTRPNGCGGSQSNTALLVGIIVPIGSVLTLGLIAAALLAIVLIKRKRRSKTLKNIAPEQQIGNLDHSERSYVNDNNTYQNTEKLQKGSSSYHESEMNKSITYQNEDDIKKNLNNDYENVDDQADIKNNYHFIDEEKDEPEGYVENFKTIEPPFMPPNYSPTRGHYYVEPFIEPADSPTGVMSQLVDKICVPEVKKENLRLDKVLGSGEFGTVNKAIWTKDVSGSDSKEDTVVAVKTLSKDASEDDRVKFLQEAAIMGQFIHPSILGLLGIVMEEPIMLIVNLMEGGDLQHHLFYNMREELNDCDILETKSYLLCYSRQICCAMTLIEKKGYVHRDLAARNILVSADGTNCKISDFGLSRELKSEEDIYMSGGGKVPLRWTAPEALRYRRYSIQSDAWSYGCVLYEIWSLGYKPYHDMDNKQVVKFIVSGKRLAPPPGCPRLMYEIMIRCWNPDADARGLFTEFSPLLLKPDFMVLKWSKEDRRAYSEKERTLGAPLEDGFHLFEELQKTYCTDK